MALRRIASSLLFANHRPIRSLSVAPTVGRTRSFATNSQMRRIDDDEDDRNLDVDRRSDRSFATRRGDLPSFLSDVFDPFSPTRSVSQLMNMIDQFADVPFTASPRGAGITGAAARRAWDAKEDENALYLRMDMPGLGKEDVKVAVEDSTLVIKGEGEIPFISAEQQNEGDGKRRYSTRIDLTPNLFKLDGIKAEMKNGVLKVVVPKVKEDERKDVVQVQVE